MEVRYAEAGDIGAIVDAARRAQDALTATGSEQRLTLPSPDAVAAHIAARAAYVLAEGGTVLGSVFVEAVTVRRMPVLARWGLDDSAYPLRYLHTLVIEPTMQGRGPGHVPLKRVKAALAAHRPAPIGLGVLARD